MASLFIICFLTVFATSRAAPAKQSDYARICENPDLMFDKPQVCQEYCTLMERSCSELADHHQSGCSAQDEHDYLLKKKEKRKQCISLLFGSECADDNCSANGDALTDNLPHGEPVPAPDTTEEPSTTVEPENSNKDPTKTDRTQPATTGEPPQAGKQANTPTETTMTTDTKTATTEQPTTSKTTTKPVETQTPRTVSKTPKQPQVVAPQQNYAATPQTYTIEDVKARIYDFLHSSHTVQLKLALTMYEIIALVTVLLSTFFFLQLIVLCCCISPLRRENQSLQRDVRELVKKMGKASRSSPK